MPIVVTVWVLIIGASTYDAPSVVASQNFPSLNACVRVKKKMDEILTSRMKPSTACVQTQVIIGYK